MVQVCCSGLIISSGQLLQQPPHYAPFFSCVSPFSTGQPGIPHSNELRSYPSSALRGKPKSTQQPTKPYVMWPPLLPPPHRLSLTPVCSRPAAPASWLLLQHAHPLPLQSPGFFLPFPLPETHLDASLLKYGLPFLLPYCILPSNSLQPDRVSSPFLLFAVATCHEVAVHSEFANKEPFAPAGNSELESCKPPATTFLSLFFF